LGDGDGRIGADLVRAFSVVDERDTQEGAEEMNEGIVVVYAVLG